MKANPEYFIEQVKIPPEATIHFFSKQPIKLFKWSQEVNEKHSIETIAEFKIYPKYAGKEKESI